MAKKKNKKKKKQNAEVVLNEFSTESDMRKAILYAYFNDTKPENEKEQIAFHFLLKLIKYNVKK